MTCPVCSDPVCPVSANGITAGQREALLRRVHPHAPTYVCAACAGAFLEATSEKEANDEALRLWNVPNASTNPTMVRICHDCFLQFQAYCATFLGRN